MSYSDLSNELDALSDHIDDHCDADGMPLTQDVSDAVGLFNEARSLADGKTALTREEVTARVRVLIPQIVALLDEK